MKKQTYLTLIMALVFSAIGFSQERTRYATIDDEQITPAVEVVSSTTGFTPEIAWEVGIYQVCALPASWGNVAPRGVATDGNDILVTASNTNKMYKYDFNGDYLGEEAHPDGIGSVLDLTYSNGKCMGGWLGDIIGVWDYENSTFEEDIVTSVSNGFMAFDEENDIIYTVGERNSGYDNPINVMTGDGELLYSFQRENNHVYSGLAYDPRVPCLWGLCKNTSSKNTLIQMSLPSGKETGVVIEMSDYLTATLSGKPAGGLSLNYLEDDDKYIFTGMVTERFVWGMYLEMDAPLAVDAEILSISAPLTKMGLLGDHQIEFRIKNSGTTTISDIPVSCSIDGQTPAVFTINETLAAGEYKDVSIPLSVTIGAFNESHEIELTVDYSGDENPDNNIFTYDLLSIEPYYYQCNSYCDYGDGVKSFELGDISNLNTGCQNNGYSDYTDMSTNLVIGNTYTASIATEGPTQSGFMWIDFNNDKFFDNETELVSDQFWIPDGGLQPAELTIPEGVEPGTYRLRVLVEWVLEEFPYYPNAQVDMGYGEMEDYSVIISAEAISADAGINSTAMKTRIRPADISPNVQVKNFGMDEKSFDVTAICGEYSSTKTVNNLASKDTITVIFDQMSVDNGDYQIEFCTELSDDEVPENDCSTLDFRVCDIDRENTVIEMGTGTWCGFCPGAALGVDDLVENGHNVAVIEYHSGDNYQISNGVDRIYYYGITAFPTSVFDGLNSYVGGGASSIYSTLLPLYEEAINAPSSYSIITTFDEGANDSYDLSVIVQNPYEYVDENLRLFVVLTESHIDESWQSLDELNFVARAVYPHSDGEPVLFESGSSFHYDLNFSVPGNYEIDNCKLNVFVQDIETKEVWQTQTYDFDLVNIADIADEQNLSIYPNPAKNRLFIESENDFNRVQLLNSTGQVILEKTISGNSAELSVTECGSGFYFIRIYSEEGVLTKKLVVE